MSKQDSVTLGPRELRRQRVLIEVVAGRWSAEQAAAALGLSVRQVWRLKATYERDGTAGLVHGNRGRSTPWRVTDAVRDRVIELARGRYAGCNDSHLADLLAREQELVLGRETLRRVLRAAGIAPARPRRAPKHRRRRDREVRAGMLLQVDGSPHHWLGDAQPRCTLLGAIDDATGAVVAAVFRAQEDAHGYFLLLRQVLLADGVPLALYHDRHGIFRREPGTKWTLEEELAGRQAPTEFGRALETLGISSIAARSPQAKGRIERLWGTLQDRLVRELALAGSTTVEAAQAFLPDFLARHNARFAVRAAEPGTAYRPLDPALDLDRVLSFHAPRVVGNDNTVRFAGQRLQLPPGPGRRSYAKAHVVVHELLDGSLGVWYRDGWLLRTAPPEMPPDLRARTRSAPHAAPAPTPASTSPAPAPTNPPEPARRTEPRRPAPDHPWRRAALDSRRHPPAAPEP